jgi:ADP-ribose pyrophosphatase YjhB (NUDIX family)
MRKFGTRAAIILVLSTVQPALACTVGIPPMTRPDLAGAKVAFIGTVETIGRSAGRLWPASHCNDPDDYELPSLTELKKQARELREELGLDPAEERDPAMVKAQRRELRDRIYGCGSIEVAFFRVEEAIRGVANGDLFAVPQGYGIDCATHYYAGMRYVFGSTGANGQVWIVKPGVEAADVLAYWQSGDLAGEDQFWERGWRLSP